MAAAKLRSLAAVLLCLVTLVGCTANGDRSDDTDNQRPVFYGGGGGSALSR